MWIGAVSFTPYIYNTNAISSNSLSKVSSIGNDLVSAKTDYSSLADESLNENPLGKGQSYNFADILDRQMYSGRLNASRIIKNEEEALPFEETGELQAEDYGLQDADKEKNWLEKIVLQEPLTGQAKAAEDFKPISSAEEMFQAQGERNLFQMRRAAEAYQMSMFI